MGVSISSLSGGSKERPVVLAREGLSYLWVKKLNRSGGELARATGMKPITVYQLGPSRRKTVLGVARMVGRMI